jgi:hypothetical protein
MRIITGDPGTLELFAFGEKTQSALNFLEDQAYRLSDSLTNTGKAFMEQGREVFQRYNGSEALRAAKAAIRTVQYCFQTDIIRPLSNIGAMQQAPLSMQRWIMACPDVRELYHQQRCDGYSDTYIDMEPASIGTDHTDYRKVMSGLIQECVEGDVDWKTTIYFEGDDDDVRLSLSEKVDIVSTWDLIKSMMTPGKEDPTSPSACNL